MKFRIRLAKRAENDLKKLKDERIKNVLLIVSKKWKNFRNV